MDTWVYVAVAVLVIGGLFWWLSSGSRTVSGKDSNFKK